MQGLGESVSANSISIALSKGQTKGALGGAMEESVFTETGSYCVKLASNDLSLMWWDDRCKPGPLLSSFRMYVYCSLKKNREVKSLDSGHTVLT